MRGFNISITSIIPVLVIFSVFDNTDEKVWNNLEHIKETYWCLEDYIMESNAGRPVPVYDCLSALLNVTFNTADV